MAKEKNTYSKISDEAIMDSLLTIHGWLEFKNYHEQAKRAMELFDFLDLKTNEQKSGTQIEIF